MTHLISEYFAVEIPDDAADVYILPSLPDDYLYFNRKFGHDGTCEKQLTGFGNCSATLIGLSDEITEIDWERIVDQIDVVCPEYGQKHKMPVDYETKRMAASFKKSGQSLLRSKNLSKRYAILKKVK